ncbi:MAG: aldo/keto reductase [Rubinisphaera brasiliensis]|uniref:Aldo/keto reductase n=1 Tax=Rubinisphaera brasiliensis (strain ATCC 49424 / DSM 5305 / JCM 21570 / IAM 15109 / NBRC 103401 / IFAM 1448) TaxID=756272 RepID=F0SNV7_RUBBR|nr:aldo/keto reductase [Rubinisphaera brasiliensis]ADY60033.1 aldo/keto reductase [Rubinisphaera brasiliensis DSM 5305]
MQRRRIGKTSLAVSDICLGTMTFGSTCDETEAFRIMDRAVEAGINFFDTAEIYPVPPDAEWVHRTEEIVGKWLKNQSRDSLIIATKFTGPGHGWFVPPVREGLTGVDRHHIRRAIEGSLRRLQTDYIDLYQTHWPDHDFPYEHTLEVLTELEQEGKIRYAGCSNETPWGLMKSLSQAELHGTIRHESIQNNFSLINRRFEDSLADICRREQVSLLPYSPIGGGVLTGKYQDGQFPAGARFTTYLEKGPRQQAMVQRFVNEKSLATTAELLGLAKELDISPAAFATAWSKQHDFVASTIIGVNTADQLEEILPAADCTLAEDVLVRIDEICGRFPYPLG